MAHDIEILGGETLIPEGDICQRCSEIGEDRRTLWMACFYAMEELDVPFTKTTLLTGDGSTEPRRQNHVFHTLRVCKDCRADWMSSIESWFKNIKKREEVGSGIFIRDNGTIKEISEKEWYERLSKGNDK